MMHYFGHSNRYVAANTATDRHTNQVLHYPYGTYAEGYNTAAMVFMIVNLWQGLAYVWTIVIGRG